MRTHGKPVIILTIALATLCGLHAGSSCEAARTSADTGRDEISSEEGRAVAGTIWYQGFLADVGTGDPITGEVEVLAELFDQETGGTLIWGPETHSDVPVVEGWFHIELGSLSPPLPAFDSPPYYLQLTIGGEVLDTRQKLASVPSALRAGSTDEPTPGMNGQILYNDGGDLSGADVYFNDSTGNLGVAQPSPMERLDVDGTVKATAIQLITAPADGHVLTSDADGVGSWQPVTGAGAVGGGGTANYVPKFTSGNEIGDSIIYESSGKLGIGTAVPNARLHIEDDQARPTLRLVNSSTDDYFDVLYIQRTEPMVYGDGMFEMRVPDGTHEDSYLISCVVGQTRQFSVRASGETFLYGDIDVRSQARTGIYVENDSTDEHATGIRGRCEGGGASSVGVRGESYEVDGIGYGAYLIGGNTGAVGYVSAADDGTHYGLRGSAGAGTGSNYGVYGNANGFGTNYAVYGMSYNGATNWAGYFAGDVRITGTLNPTRGGFEIDHPLDPANRYLRHSFVESPDMKTVHDGIAVLDGIGQAWVEVPQWFEAVNGELRYQLTAIGAPAPELHIAAKLAGGRFRIAGGAPGAEVCWQVTGIRHDPVAQAYRIIVDEEKKGADRDKYLNPELYGAEESARIGYVEVRDPIAP